MKFIFITILFCFTRLQAFCCLCGGNESLQNAIKFTDILFKGRIEEMVIVEKFDTLNFYPYNKYSNRTATKSDSLLFTTREIHYKVRIEQLYKGSYSSTVIDIQSGAIGLDDCKYNFEVGKTYIIFAFNPLMPQFRKSGIRKRMPKKDYSQLKTNDCKPNQLYNDNFEKEILSYLK